MEEYIQNYIKKLFIRLNELIPTEKAKHNITLGDNGDLMLSVFVNGRWAEFGFSPEDDKTPPEEIAEQMLEHLITGGFLNDTN